MIKQKDFVLEKGSLVLPVMFSHLAYACVKESVRTRDMGMMTSHA